MLYVCKLLCWGPTTKVIKLLDLCGEGLTSVMTVFLHRYHGLGYGVGPVTIHFDLMGVICEE